jgi:hypothetical protein
MCVGASRSACIDLVTVGHGSAAHADRRLKRRRVGCRTRTGSSRLRRRRARAAPPLPQRAPSKQHKGAATPCGRTRSRTHGGACDVCEPRVGVCERCVALSLHTCACACLCVREYACRACVCGCLFTHVCARECRSMRVECAGRTDAYEVNTDMIMRALVPRCSYVGTCKDLDALLTPWHIWTCVGIGTGRTCECVLLLPSTGHRNTGAHPSSSFALTAARPAGSASSRCSRRA